MIETVLYVSGQTRFEGLAPCHVVAGMFLCTQDTVRGWLL